MNTFNSIRDAFCLQLCIVGGLVTAVELYWGADWMDNGLQVLFDLRETQRVASAFVALLYWFVFLRI